MNAFALADRGPDRGEALSSTRSQLCGVPEAGDPGLNEVFTGKPFRRIVPKRVRVRFECHSR